MLYIGSDLFFCRKIQYQSRIVILPANAVINLGDLLKEQ